VHKARSVLQCFTESIVEKLDWPAQTPDLNSLNSFEIELVSEWEQSSASMSKHPRKAFPDKQKLLQQRRKGLLL